MSETKDFPKGAAIVVGGSGGIGRAMARGYRRRRQRFLQRGPRRAAPPCESGAGSFVYISSAGLKRFPAGDVLSVAPKGAIEALLRGIAKEEGRFGIRANSVALGVIDAGMFPRLVERGELSNEWVDAAKRNAALRRFGTAVEVAEAVAFLASRRASYITGQTLLLDGGYTL
jgi:NAD(P)-dependent dehydrogenase (short-subunit alcohol dehydrogenase family)